MIERNGLGTVPQAFAGEEVRAELSSITWEADGQMPPQKVVATVQPSGEYMLPLWPNARGVHATHWKLYLPTTNKPLTLFVADGAGDFDISQALTAGVGGGGYEYDNLSALMDAWLDEQQQVVDLAVADATGAANAADAAAASAAAAAASANAAAARRFFLSMPVVSGSLIVATDVLPGGPVFMRPVTIDQLRVDVGTAPVGAGITVAVYRNTDLIGTLIINAGATTATQNLSGGGAPFAAGDRMRVDVGSVGSTTAGADLWLSAREAA